MSIVSIYRVTSINTFGADVLWIYCSVVII